MVSIEAHVSKHSPHCTSRCTSVRTESDQRSHWRMQTRSKKDKRMSQNSNIRTEEIQSEIYNTSFFKKPSTLVANNEAEVLQHLKHLSMSTVILRWKPFALSFDIESFNHRRRCHIYTHAAICSFGVSFSLVIAKISDMIRFETGSLHLQTNDPHSILQCLSYPTIRSKGTQPPLRLQL